MSALQQFRRDEFLTREEESCLKVALAMIVVKRRRLSSSSSSAQIKTATETTVTARQPTKKAIVKDSNVSSATPTVLDDKSVRGTSSRMPQPRQQQYQQHDSKKQGVLPTRSPASVIQEHNELAVGSLLSFPPASPRQSHVDTMMQVAIASALGQYYSDVGTKTCCVYQCDFRPRQRPNNMPLVSHGHPQANVGSGNDQKTQRRFDDTSNARSKLDALTCHLALQLQLMIRSAAPSSNVERRQRQQQQPQHQDEQQRMQHCQIQKWMRRTLVDFKCIEGGKPIATATESSSSSSNADISSFISYIQAVCHVWHAVLVHGVDVNKQNTTSSASTRVSDSDSPSTTVCQLLLPVIGGLLSDLYHGRSMDHGQGGENRTTNVTPCSRNGIHPPSSDLMTTATTSLIMMSSRVLNALAVNLLQLLECAIFVRMHEHQSNQFARHELLMEFQQALATNGAGGTELGHDVDDDVVHEDESSKFRNRDDNEKHSLWMLAPVALSDLASFYQLEQDASQKIVATNNNNNNNATAKIRTGLNASAKIMMRLALYELVHTITTQRL